MGSWDATCMASNLGISAGTPVRALLICQNKYPEMNDYYTPILWPIKAKYDDYGGIDGYDPKDVEAWIEALRPYIVPNMEGDNKYHDTRINPNELDVETFLEGLQEKRIFIARKSVKEGIKDPFPLENSISKAYSDSFLTSYGNNTFLITSNTFQDKNLIEAKDKIQEAVGKDYVVVETKSLTNGPSLLVYPSPECDGVGIYPELPPDKGLRVEMTLIREDVYQKMCSIQADMKEDPYFKLPTAEAIANEMIRAKETSESQFIYDAEIELSSKLRAFSFDWRNIIKSPVKAVMKSYYTTDISKKELKNRLEVALDRHKSLQALIAMSYILRFTWRNTTCGKATQGAEYDHQLKFYKELSKIAAKEVKDREY